MNKSSLVKILDSKDCLLKLKDGSYFVPKNYRLDDNELSNLINS